MKVSQKYAQYLIIKSQVCIYKSFYFILSLFKTKQKQPGKNLLRKKQDTLLILRILIYIELTVF